MSFLNFLRANIRWLLAGFLLTFSSSYGQTFFIAIFSGEIRAEFGLSHGAWGGIYTIATSLSAAAMIWGGALTDRFRVRGLGALVLCGLALACLAMALLPAVWMLVPTILALRFFGQGMSTHIAGVGMARWFKAARGRALSVAMMGIALGNAVLPLIFAALLLTLPWRSLWFIAALMALVAVPLVLFLLNKERSPRGTLESDQSAGMQGRHWTRAEALKSPIAWMLIPALIGPPCWGTALLFQQVYLTEIKGWALIDFVALFPLMTIVSVFVTFLSGMAIDRFGAVRLMPLLMAPWAITFVLFASANSLGIAALAMVMLGVGQGAGSTLTIAFVAEVFGTRNLGSIKAVVAALGVFGSAIGPGVTGFLIDWNVGFNAQLAGFAVYFVIAGLLALLAAARVRAALPSAAP